MKLSEHIAFCANLCKLKKKIKSIKISQKKNICKYHEGGIIDLT